MVTAWLKKIVNTVITFWAVMSYVVVVYRHEHKEMRHFHMYVRSIIDVSKACSELWDKGTGSFAI